ncbi:MAG: aldo/keto reductase [Treponema sp.]|nr:aldo/keto reductase [Treponema sp.]
MEYVDFGKTGHKVSRLGMGCMRLPSYEKDGKTIFDEEKGIALIQRAIELGVNYFDTAPFYCDRMSEVILGKALQGGRREKILLSTKCPMESGTGDDYQKNLEGSLKQLGTSHIDFYHFWGISLKTFVEKVAVKGGALERAQKLKEEGLIKHISFSFHDRDAKEKEGDNLKEILKKGEGILETVLVQYNLMDRVKEEGIALAHQMGLGTVIMGPVGGGRLGAPSKAIMDMLPGKVASTAELALRFVLANQNVNIALSGVSTIEQLEENVRVTSNTSALSQEELQRIDAMMEENKRLAELYCTGCNYCMPCPANINIPAIFGMMNNHRVYGLTQHAEREYNSIGKNPWMKFENASVCTDCGACETKCPQSIPIREQLKETHSTLAK